MHLLACISHHGRGHLAQSAPVLDALLALWPGLKLTVRSALPHSVLAGRIRGPFTHLSEAADCGFLMRDALRVDLEASLKAYRAFHAEWQARVEREAGFLRAARIDGVLCNVAYLPLAAAQVAGLPSAALCSLNWLDIFRHYLGDAPEAAAITQQMAQAYQSAAIFFRPEPSMPMADLANTRAVPPIAELGVERREELRRRLRLPTVCRLVLVGMGGVAYRLQGEHWCRGEDLVWLVPDDWDTDGRRVFGFSQAGMPFGDLLASCDALVTKPGYGSFVEAALAGVPVLYLPRRDWPETPYLTDWLHRNADALEIDEEAWRLGRAEAALQRLWAQAPRQPVRADGASIVAQRLKELFG
ncbi:MAG: hypothetical protein ACUVT2_07990 [Thiobacillaceae bacterium]